MISSMDGGGSERQTLLILRHLRRDQFSPELFVLRRGGSLYSQIPSDVPVHCFADSTTPSRWHIPGLRLPGGIHRDQVAFVKSLLRERQIDVVYDRTFHMTLIAGPAARVVGVPRVSTIVSPPSHAVPQNAGRFLSLKKRQLARYYAEAAQTIAVSAPTAQDARLYYHLKPHKIITLPNPVDADSLDAAVASATAPDRDDRYTLVCVGRMTKEKGHACLIAAFGFLKREYPDFPLPRIWMVGDGPLRGSLEQQSLAIGVRDCIDFIGHVAQPAPWIAAADALCLPSTFEGFPNVMLEAMALGTPVIASNLPVVRSLGRLDPRWDRRGRDYVAIYQVNDPLHLAKKIRRLWLNATATYSRKQSAKRLARETLCPQNIVPRLEAIMLKHSPKHRQGK